MRCACSWHPLLKLGAGRQLHLKGRALTQGRLDPNPPAVHFDNLLGDGEPQAGPTLGLSVRAVDLMELLEDAGSMLLRYSWAGIGHTDGEVPVHGFGRHANFTR